MKNHSKNFFLLSYDVFLTLKTNIYSAQSMRKNSNTKNRLGLVFFGFLGFFLSCIDVNKEHYCSEEHY